MNLYTHIGAQVGSLEAAALSKRLAAWHDAMVAHERRLRLARAAADCHEDCPHAEAGELWPQAVATFAERANALAFLRSRATLAHRTGGAQ